MALIPVVQKTFCYMQPHICYYYYIISTFQPEDLMQMISLYYSVRYYWINRLNIALNSVPKYGDLSGTTNQDL